MRWALVSVLFVIGCESNKSSTPTPLVDSNTNWLNVCGDEDACAEGTECVCGVCTQTCDQAACEEFRPGSTCVQGGSSDRLCDEVVAPSGGMCLPGCDVDTPCPRGQLCLDGACQPEERRRPRCDERFPCRNGRECMNGRCEMPPPPPPCDNNDECVPGALCLDGRCGPAPECARGDVCPDGAECRDGRCLRVRLCDTDEMCPPDAACDDGECVTLGDCRTNDACPQGSSCEAGRCERTARCRVDDECAGPERCIRGTCRVPPPCPLGQNTFCGFAVGGAETQGLYACERGDFELLEVCDEACLGRPGIGDQCATACPDGPGTYCGDTFGVDATALIRCEVDRAIQVAQCPAGCESETPGDASCAPVE